MIGPATSIEQSPAPGGVTSTGQRPGVVILGAGFGGLACAVALGGSDIPVTIIDRRNYHLFVPLLYQVATAALSPADIAQPIRRILSRYKNIKVLLGEVQSVTIADRQVLLRDGGRVPYDTLIVATGSEYAYFGHDEWARYAPGLKSIEDAQYIRSRMLQAFEQAELTDDPARQQELTTTVIVGGGPTGVEMAGAAAELAHYALARDFRNVRPEIARIILVEAGPRILAGFPESLSIYAHQQLEKLGVQVWTGKAVEQIDADGVVIQGTRMKAGTLVWGAGVKASQGAGWIPAERDRSGRIVVAPDLSVPGLPGIYVIGDLAHSLGFDGKPLPALAQVASQQGRHLGNALREENRTGAPVPPFHFRDRGNTAIIGRNAAVFDFGRRSLRGRIAWILWAIVHVYLLVGFEKRLSVTMQWLWRYATYQRGARLIIPPGPRQP